MMGRQIIRARPDTSRFAVAVRMNKVCALTEAGESASYIARKLDLTTRTVTRLRTRLREQGRLPRRQPPETE